MTVVGKKKAKKKPSAKLVQADSISRRIIFYRAILGVDASGQPQSWDFLPALKAVGQLQVPDVYLERDLGDIACWVRRTSPHAHVVLGNIRRRGWPQHEEDMVLKPLTLTPTSPGKRPGLAESTHVVVFPEGIVGVEYNPVAPRLQALSEYLTKKVPGTGPHPVFEELVLEQASEKIAEASGLVLVRLTVRTAWATHIKMANNSVHAALTAIARASEADKIDLVLRKRRAKLAVLSDQALRFVKGLLKQKDLAENLLVGKVQARDEDGAVYPVDLLGDRVMATKKMIPLAGSSNAVDSDSAFKAIESAYDELKDSIATAASFGVEEDES